MLQILEAELEQEHKSVLVTRLILAKHYQKMGMYEKALLLYQKELGICVGIFDPEHVLVTGTLENIAAVYSIMAEYEKALSIYQIV